MDDKYVPVGAGAELAATISKQVKTIQSGAKNLVAGAGSGFYLEPEAAATLIKSCHDSLDQLDLLDRELSTLAQAPKLGISPGARAVAPFTLSVATDEQGIQHAIDGLKSILNDMITAYQKASTNYARTEEALARGFHNKA